MIHIRYVQEQDQQFWFSLDSHLSLNEFKNKVKNRRGYILFEENQPIGILRYNLFWDQIPFCTLLYIDSRYQKQGYGKKLMEYWQQDMEREGYGMLLVSTQVDEQAQHFYRKLGYQDCGSLIINIPRYAQPMEMFMSKAIGK